MAEKVSYIDLVPSDNNFNSIGTSSKQWNAVYAQTVFENGSALSSKYLGLTATASSSFVLATPRSITIQGDITSVAQNFDGSANISFSAEVAALRGRAVSATAPNLNQVLRWNGSSWDPATIIPSGGGASHYLRGDSTWQTLSTAILGTSLSGLSVVNSPITATDNILVAFGEAQGQIDAINLSLGSYVAKAGDNMSGALSISNNIGGEFLTLDSGTADFALIRSKGATNSGGWTFGSGSNGWFTVRNEDTLTSVFQISRTTNNATFTNRVTANSITSTTDLSVGTTGSFGGLVSASAAPTLGQHLTNKTYVDALVATKQNYSAALDNIDGLNGAGIVVHSGGDNFALRTLQAGSGISISHGNGSSDPSISIDSATLSSYVLKAGDTMTGALSVSNNLGGTKLTLNSGTGNGSMVLFKDGITSAGGWRAGVSNAGTGDFLLVNDNTAGTLSIIVNRTTNNVGIASSLSVVGAIDSTSSFVRTTRTENDTTQLPHFQMRRGSGGGDIAFLSSWGNGSNGVESIGFFIGATSLNRVYSSGLHEIYGALTSSGSITATAIIRSGGSSSQFLKADGSVDSNSYLTSNQSITLSGEVSGTGTTSLSTTIANTAVIGKVLTGFSSTNAAIAATDTILQAFNKTQGQISAKENTITAGTTSQYWRGDKSWQTLDTSIVPENTNLYYTNARAVGSVLTGYTLGSNVSIAATDTILQALGKTQAQIDAKANTSALSSYLLLTGGTVTGTLSLTSAATTGQPSYWSSNTSAGASLTLRYSETTIGSIPADVFQFRMGGSDGSRNIVWSYFDNTPVLTIAPTGVSVSSLTVSAGINAASIPTGTISSGGNLGLDASGNLVKATVSGGGGSSYLLGSLTVSDNAWSGNTDYTYVTTISGATIGSPVVVSPDTNIANVIFANTLTMYAWVSAANQVSVRVRVATWVPLPATRTLRLGVLI